MCMYMPLDRPIDMHMHMHTHRNPYVGRPDGPETCAGPPPARTPAPTSGARGSRARWRPVYRGAASCWWVGLMLLMGWRLLPFWCACCVARLVRGAASGRSIDGGGLFFIQGVSDLMRLAIASIEASVSAASLRGSIDRPRSPKKSRRMCMCMHAQ